jgi:DNA mismatch repair protein MutS
MFMASEPAADLPVHPVVSALDAIQVDDLTPKQALDLLYKLKDLLKN